MTLSAKGKNRLSSKYDNKSGKINFQGIDWVLIGMKASYIAQYRVEREIGRGGMATVYLACQENLDRHVALKVLSDQLMGDSQFVQRFADEAKIAAQLNHPNIVKIYDIGTADDKYYICMEYVAGRPLSEIINESGQLPLERAIPILIQIAEALDYAHGNGIVHRDVKPSNILVGEGDKVTIMDFGVARAAGYSHLTKTGAYVGTPANMSPEQAEGKEIDGRSDLCSLGILLYVMLTGEVPYDSESPLGTLAQHIHAAIPSLKQKRPDVPEWMEAVYYRAMAKDPLNRYQSGAELARDLASAGTGVLMRPVPASRTLPGPAIPRAVSEVRRSMAIKLVVGGIVLTLAALLCVLLLTVYLGTRSHGEFAGGSGGSAAIGSTLPTPTDTSTPTYTPSLRDEPFVESPPPYADVNTGNLPAQQAVQMGPKAFVDWFTTQRDDTSEAGQDTAYLAYARLRRSVNDAELEQVQIAGARQEISRLREALTNWEQTYIGLCAISAGGGTLFGHALGRSWGPREDVIGEVIAFLNNPVSSVTARAEANRTVDRIRTQVEAKRVANGDIDVVMGGRKKYDEVFRELEAATETIASVVQELPDDAAKRTAEYVLNTMGRW